jgi:hypothetical protein
MTLEQLKYPIGKFEKPEIITESILSEWISEIAAFPANLKAEVSHLDDGQLDSVYRPEGWTIRQVVHHCADSHMNSLIRFKLALTEERPIIKPYQEEKWAELADGKMPIAPSLMLLEGLHARWVVLLQSLSEEDLRRVYIHPQQEQEVPLTVAIGLYAWHGKHHLAHITEAKKREEI